MPEITLIEPQKKNLPAGRQGPRRFNVFLDGVFAFGADEDLLVSHRLTIGKKIDQQLLPKILFEAQANKWLNKIYSLLSIRPRSEKEIRDYFKVQNFKLRMKEAEEVSGLVIDFVVDVLKTKGLINDLEFAKSWVESRRRGKSKGVIALKSELFGKGIDREIINQVLQQDSGQNEEQLASGALEKKLKSWKDLDQLDFKKKAVQFLLRKGFAYSIATKVVAKYLKKD